MVPATPVLARRPASGGKFAGDNYVGTTCEAHMCGDVEALTFLDAGHRKVFLAWEAAC